MRERERARVRVNTRGERGLRADLPKGNRDGEEGGTMEEGNGRKGGGGDGNAEAREAVRTTTATTTSSRQRFRDDATVAPCTSTQNPFRSLPRLYMQADVHGLASGGEGGRD